VTRVGSGTFVAERQSAEPPSFEPSDDSPSDFVEARLVLEVACTRLAARRGTTNLTALDELRVNVEALESAAHPDEFPDELDRAFHRDVSRLAGNEYLNALLEPLWETMLQPLYTTLRRRTWSQDDTARTAAEHRAIYEALRAGDPELAAFAMERHLRSVMARLFDDEAFEGPPPRYFA
jgi:GntR family transcriptional repressor for pyruvate dehydrogenase complex